MRQNGFTLIELMVTIAIAAILLLVAAPSFVTYRQNSQLTAAANTFLANAFAARAEAMKRQLNVFVRPAGADWSAGWTSYVDGDWDNFNNTPGVDITLSTQGPLTQVTISNDTTPSDSNPLRDVLGRRLLVVDQRNGHQPGNCGVLQRRRNPAGHHGRFRPHAGVQPRDRHDLHGDECVLNADAGVASSRSVPTRKNRSREPKVAGSA